MNDETPKTPLDHVNDLTMQLKEMRHYSKNNVELLTAQWLKFDEGKLKKLGESKTIEDLMTGRKGSGSFLYGLAPASRKQGSECTFW